MSDDGLLRMIPWMKRVEDKQRCSCYGSIGHLGWIGCMIEDVAGAPETD